MSVIILLIPTVIGPLTKPCTKPQRRYRQQDGLLSNHSPGSIAPSDIPERIADDYGPREGEVTGVFDGIISTPSEQEGEQCFFAGTPITMWPIDPSLKPGPDGVYDQAQVRAGFWRKPIEEITDTDWVVAYDACRHPTPRKQQSGDGRGKMNTASRTLPKMKENEQWKTQPSILFT